MIELADSTNLSGVLHLLHCSPDDRAKENFKASCTEVIKGINNIQKITKFKVRFLKIVRYREEKLPGSRDM